MTYPPLSANRVSWIVLLLIFLLTACSGSENAPDGDTDTDPPAADGDSDADSPEEDANGDSDEDGDPDADGETEPPEAINGFILLEADAESVQADIEQAAAYGANHVQLSHNLIMEIDEILGDSEEVQTRVDLLNQGIDQAHQLGMKAFIWAHEFSETPLGICYAPDSEIWTSRIEAYRRGFEKLPGLDGVILMFGSSPRSPWETVCNCDWCTDTYGGTLLDSPPQSERIRLIVEHVGGAIVNEMGKELFVRTFVHEPNEIDWHSDGLRAAEGVAFTGMHKAAVQDWQPYNPPHPSMGNIGDHPCIMEVDVAGEYYGQSVLPFAAPGYYRYRMNHMWKNRGLGTAIRISRDGHHTFGTPNEINIKTIIRLLDEPKTDLDLIWSDFLRERYGLAEGADQAALQRILAESFPIRRKCHYALGIWAHDQSSRLPKDDGMEQFTLRGDMPKWNAEYTEIWNELRSPTMLTVLKLWQESSEAVDLADEALSDLPELETLLSAEDFEDISERIRHQAFDARAWRAVDLYVWAKKASALAEGDEAATLSAYALWARQKLGIIKENMIQDGFSGADLSSPELIQRFLDNTTEPDAENVVEPPEALFFPVRIQEVTKNSATVRITARRQVKASLDYGPSLPNYGQEIDLGTLNAGEEKTVVLENLEPNSRTVVRIRETGSEAMWVGGDFWIFTKAE